MSKYEDFLFEINDSFRRRDEGLELAVHETNSIRFEMSTEDDDKLTLESVIRIDDINTLDLPTLYFKSSEDAQVIDFYDDDSRVDTKRSDSASTTTRKGSRMKIETAKSWLRVRDMTIESAAKYEVLSRRTPFSFDMAKAKKKEEDQAASDTSKSKFDTCKLPVMFFWLNKPVQILHHKNTGFYITNMLVY